MVFGLCDSGRAEDARMMYEVTKRGK